MCLSRWSKKETQITYFKSTTIIENREWTRKAKEQWYSNAKSWHWHCEFDGDRTFNEIFIIDFTFFLLFIYFFKTEFLFSCYRLYWIVDTNVCMFRAELGLDGRFLNAYFVTVKLCAFRLIEKNWLFLINSVHFFSKGMRHF